ncbi:MAG TPA: site-specific integrase [Pyrinomonadaceae bacterium]|jgi:integrase
MARERRGFIVVQVWATIIYADKVGERQQITKPASAQTSGKKNHNLTDAEKQKRKIEHAKRIIRETISELKRTGATDCKGSVGTRILARVGHTDSQGKRHDIVRVAESRTDAREKIKEILQDLEERGGKTIEASRMTFADLAAHFEKHYLKEAEYIDGRKVDGVRSLVPAQVAVNALKRHFGRKRLQSISYGDIRSYKAARLKDPTIHDLARHKRELEQDRRAEVRVTRTIATVNRELAKLRRMLNIAQREGWIKQNPFTAGESLISLADERKRERILSRDEERVLLAACADHLRPIVIAAIDTGMRRGEIFSLRWRDVDFEHGLINIQAFNTKTMRERQVSLTARLASELQTLWEQSPQDERHRVFGIISNVKRSFTAARNASGLQDLRFHDLRHTHATRLVGAHIPLSEVGRVLGHSQPNTTYRYVNANVDTARRASAALDAFNAENESTSEVSEVVN